MQCKQLMFEFFLLFSKFEYALKMVGFHMGDGTVKIDWTMFAESINNEFNKESNDELLESIGYIFSCPPKKQIIKDGLLQWSDNPPDSISDLDLLLKYICRVRNNLFHGGKYKNRYLEDSDRSERLLFACISILRQCLLLSDNVRQAFEQNFSEK